MGNCCGTNSKNFQIKKDLMNQLLDIRVQSKRVYANFNDKYRYTNKRFTRTDLKDVVKAFSFNDETEKVVKVYR